MDDVGNIVPGSSDNRIPLGLLKQAVMKLDASLNDINEAKLDEDLDENEVHALEGCSEIIYQVMAVIVNIVNQEMEEDEFISEQIDMDEIDEYPGEEKNLLDTEISKTD